MNKGALAISGQGNSVECKTFQVMDRRVPCPRSMQNARACAFLEKYFPTEPLLLHSFEQAPHLEACAFQRDPTPVTFAVQSVPSTCSALNFPFGGKTQRPHFKQGGGAPFNLQLSIFVTSEPPVSACVTFAVTVRRMIHWFSAFCLATALEFKFQLEKLKTFQL